MTDIQDYGEGQRNWDHEEGCLDHELVGTDHISALTGLSETRCAPRVYEERWDRVPPPSGKAGHRQYWLRSLVNEWERERAAGETPTAQTVR